MSGRRHRAWGRRLAWLLVLVAAGAGTAYWLAPPEERAALLAEGKARSAPLGRAVTDLIQTVIGQAPGEASGEAGRESMGADAARQPEDGGEGAADTAPSRVEIVGGVPTVRLDAELQKRGGIRTETLKAITFTPEIMAFGQVMDIQPLLRLRAEFITARYTADVIRAGLTAKKTEYERLRALHQDQQNIATKRLQQAEAAWKRDQVRLHQAMAEARAVREATRQAWGPAITGIFLAKDSAAFKDLLDRKEVLILVALSGRQALPKGTRQVFFSRSGGRKAARKARFLAPAPFTDPVTQGETYFFRATTGALRSDMQVDVWVPQTGKTIGVVVPGAAVVWATGKAWAYVQIDDQHFARRAVPTAIEAPGGWFVRQALRPGERVVVTGVQTLFAEEFRWRIRNEGKD